MNEERYEAREWLQSNPNESALAGNRFEGTADALAFVEHLYAEGAVHVSVTGISDEPWRIELEGGPYADTLIVELPADGSQRSVLFRICNEEAWREGFSPELDSGQREVLLWWD
jgi:hypothetical protein